MLVLADLDRKQRVECLAFSPDGGRIAAGTNGGVVALWPAGGGRVDLVASIELAWHGPWVRQVEFSPDGRHLVAALDGTPGLLVRDLASRTDVPVPPLWRATGFAVAPDGPAVVYHGTERAGPGGLAALSWRTERFEPLWAVPDNGTSGRVRYFPDGRRVLAGVQLVDGAGPPLRAQLAVREADSGRVVREFDVPNGTIDEVAVSPCGGKVVAVSRAALFAFDAGRPNRPAAKATTGTRKHFTGAAFHPSGRYLAATSNDTTVKLYDTESWQLARTYTWGVGRLRSVALSPDGTLAAAGSDAGKVVVWDVDL
jgi:WD40 repeat protein